VNRDEALGSVRRIFTPASQRMLITAGCPTPSGRSACSSASSAMSARRHAGFSR
jgi:hypothetical protein